MDLTRTYYSELRRGDRLVNPFLPGRPPRVVRDVHQARARGYLVIVFEDGERTSGHGSTECCIDKTVQVANETR